ncbi:MAG: inorganic phosphate transporter [Candidatus Hadarchaeales archaeon]
MIVWLVYLVGMILSCAMAWALGANDASNPTECAVGAGVISLRKAITLFAIFAALGGILIGPFVIKTFDRGLVDRKTGFETGLLNKETLILGSLTSALATIIWVAVSTWLGMPVSTTHSAIGSILGFGLIACPSLIGWGKLKLVAVSIVLSPVLSALLAAFFFYVMRHIFLRGSNKKILLTTAAIVFFIFLTTSISIFQIFWKGKISEIVFVSTIASVLGSLIIVGLMKRKKSGKDWREGSLAFLLILSLSFSAFAFGANDLANATGVFVTPTEILTGKPTLTTMLILAILGSIFIALGGFTWGPKVIATAAYRITKLDPLMGFSAELSNALCVFLFTTVPAWLTGFGIPISTTHSSVGSIIGVGLAAGGFGSIHRGTTGKILAFWALTIPCAAFISMGIFRLLSWVII